MLHITAEHDCRRLHCSLRDLSSVLQALGLLADHFIGDDKFTASFHDAYLLVDRSECISRLLASTGIIISIIRQNNNSELS